MSRSKSDIAAPAASNHLLTYSLTHQLSVIPVLDLKAGVVVRAVGGQREAYQPLTSSLVDGCEPLAVAHALAAKVGHQQLYLADLDAIAGSVPAWSVYQSLLAARFDVWLDAGLSSVRQAAAISEMTVRDKSVHSVIAALESLPDLATLAAILAAGGRERLAFSLDLCEGRPLARVPALQKRPLALVDEVASLGVQRVIALDVASVGMNEGPRVVDLCREIRRRAPQLELIAGGGVRGALDLSRLRDAGADAALVSSWLHAGS